MQVSGGSGLNVTSTVPVAAVSDVTLPVTDQAVVCETPDDIANPPSAIVASDGPAMPNPPAPAQDGPGPDIS